MIANLFVGLPFSYYYAKSVQEYDDELVTDGGLDDIRNNRSLKMKGMDSSSSEDELDFGDDEEETLFHEPKKLAKKGRFQLVMEHV